MGALPQPEESGKLKITIVLPRDLSRRIRRAMSLNKRTFSGEVEFAMERHVEEVERQHGLSAKSLSDENWPE